MSELEEIEFDKRILRSAMENTYMILTGRATWDSLMDKASMQPGSVDQHVDVALLFDPMDDDYNPDFPHLHNDVDISELFESMIDYYVETEEYEKCAEILKIKEKNYGTER
tara:strand:- start:200 stop:532 length:333 start_codon:yes stop_codon:yes gene_type:complete